MTPKEKAEELVSMFVAINLSQVNDLVDGIRIRLAKECALIAVEQIYINNTDESKNDYWIEVKQEIENL